MVYNKDMGKITDITKQRNGKRANIFIDGVYRCGLELITVAAAHLKIGDELDDDALETLQMRSESEKAFDRAVGYLSVRRRTKREIERKLREKGYLPAVIANVTAKLTEYGYVDDRKFCEEYVDLYKNTYGAYRMTAELKKLGVDGETVREVLEEKLDDDTRQDAAVEAVRKYLRTHDFDKVKLMRHMAGRGFGYGEVRDALSAIGEDADDVYED
jgi:regulatory protein